MRIFGLLWVVALTGCASTWDTVTNRQWQKDLVSQPSKVFWGEDPMVTLRSNPDGAARAKAMLKLTPPDRQSQEYAEIQTLLGDAATNDPSPVVRAAAIEALGKFTNDDRTIDMLNHAYMQSTGAGQSVAGSGEPDRRMNLFGPSGFPPEVVSLLKTRTIEAMAKTGHPSAKPFILEIAKKPLDPKTATPVDRDVRLTAITVMKNFRDAETATALATIMTHEMTRDTAAANRAHDGLVALTGQRYPMQSPEWGQVISAGAPIADEPNMIQRAAAWFVTP